MDRIRRPSLRLLTGAAACTAGLAAAALWAPVVLVITAPWLACVAWGLARDKSVDGFVPVGYAEAARRRLAER